MAAHPDIVIVGGGVIGCAIAYELSKQGQAVLVLEKDLLGSGASQASAGMLAPLSDSLEEGPVMELGARSLQMYPKFLEQVESDSGMFVECLASGIIRVAADEREAASLQAGLAVGSKLGIDLQYLTGEEARKLEPLLGPAVVAATYSPSEPQLSAGRLVEALHRAAVNCGALFREHAPVTGLERRNGRVVGVRLPQETITASTVVLAMGSWACYAGDWLGWDLPVYPVRGQVVYVNNLTCPLRHSVTHGSASYATPKGDGTTLVGATQEHVGFDQRVTVAGMTTVLSQIQDVLPSIGESTVNHTRAGLRPWSTDHMPVLGPVPGLENVIIAAGHHRSGILLTPITAKMIGESILKALRPDDFGSYTAARLKRREA